MCYVTHHCEVNFIEIANVVGNKDKPPSSRIMHNGNPHIQCMFTNDDTVICTGFDKVPFVYKSKGTEWATANCLDQGIKNVRKAKITGNSFTDKKVYFNPDIKLNTNVELKETDTMHVNFINCTKPFAMNGANVKMICTSDANGVINYWNCE